MSVTTSGLYGEMFCVYKMDIILLQNSAHLIFLPVLVNDIILQYVLTVDSTCELSDQCNLYYI